MIGLKRHGKQVVGWLGVPGILALILVCNYTIVHAAKMAIIPSKTVHYPFPKGIPLVTKHKAISILVDAKDAEVVGIAAKAVSSDIGLITGVSPKVIYKLNGEEYLIIAGTIGQSSDLDKLINSGKINVSAIRNKWESFAITTVNTPIKGVKKAIVIAGSDRRGTAYGIFELSRKLGVSPWVWWADVKPEKKPELFFPEETIISMEPSVRYRGIFLNDEDWGLQPWAAKNLDTDIKDIGPKTYAKVFELLLRLRGNFIWPAMHEVTKAFYHYPENPKVADRYAIVVGSSHCEPMLRNNIFEWNVNFEKEYREKPLAWRYDQNKTQIFRYWNDRIKASKSYESVYTVGMRGIHDSGMPGPKDKAGKISLMNAVLTDQRTILNTEFGNASKVPQIFCPYKEVLGLYQGGVQVPDDVTLLWPDDNFGYIRQLSTPTEQKRSGRSGVYYHLSYYGAPHDYLWLSTNSPALISYEMTKAYQFGADRLWLVNVGDIKPNEMETEFFMDLAWDTAKWTPEKASYYSTEWASRTFGTHYAQAIGKIKEQFFLLSQNAKPEHLSMLAFTPKDMQNRISAYQQLSIQVDRLKKNIPAGLQDAYFELIEYPVKGSALMNQKIFYARLSLDQKLSVDEKTSLAKKSQAAFEQIKTLTACYNTTLQNGKWAGMMDFAPRKLPVFDMPKTYLSASTNIDPKSATAVKLSRYNDTIPATFLNKGGNTKSVLASAYRIKKPLANEKILVLKGLGIDGQGISRYPFTGLSFNEAEYSKAPFVEYNIELDKGNYQLSVKCLPNQAIHQGRMLRMAVSLNGNQAEIFDVNHPTEDRIWAANLLRGYSEAKFNAKITTKGTQHIRIYLMDTGLVLNRIDIKNTDDNYPSAM